MNPEHKKGRAAYFAGDDFDPEESEDWKEGWLTAQAERFGQRGLEGISFP